MMLSLPVIRPLSIPALRQNPRTRLGSADVNFKPMFDNPMALINIAQKLRSIPQLAEVRVDKLEAVEVRQGLVIRSFLNYSLKPGACRDAARRIQVAATGLRCAVQISAAARAAAFASPTNARYVSDPGLRATKLAEAKTLADKADAETAQAVASFRAQLNDSTQSAQLAAALGAAEVQQLKAMDDTALAGELINSGETKIEQVAFVPTLDDADKAPPKKKLNQPPPLELPKPLNEEFNIGKNVFLTGFTLGREHEWRERIEKSIKWCFVGCKKTYYAEVYAGFKYGFGLRFPIKFEGKVKFVRENGKDSAVMVADMTPFDGSAADYAAAGLPSYQIFDGKELIAEVGAKAGFGANLPFYPTIAVDFAVEKDFTDALPAPITNGQFTPPAPGAPIVFVKNFDDFDLIGGLANFGAFGAKLFPAVKVTVGSEMLKFNIVDQNSGSTIPFTQSGAAVNLRTNPQNSAIAFKVEDPLYTLTFGVEPGIVARLFIDLGVWGNNWDWPVWFPDLKVTLPPEGLTFSCHDNTTCSRSFKFEPKVTSSASDDEIQIWAVNYEKKWLPLCIDDTCSFAIRLVRLGTVGLLKKDAAMVATGNGVSVGYSYKGAAEKDAAAIVLDAQARKAQSTSNAWAQLAQGVWTKHCADKQCYDDIKAIAAMMGPRASVLRKLFPEDSDLKVQGMVNKEFGPKFKLAVQMSKTRILASQ